MLCLCRHRRASKGILNAAACFPGTKELIENYNSQNALLQGSVWLFSCPSYWVHGPHLSKQEVPPPNSRQHLRNVLWWWLGEESHTVFSEGLKGPTVFLVGWLASFWVRTLVLWPKKPRERKRKRERTQSQDPSSSLLADLLTQIGARWLPTAISILPLRKTSPTYLWSEVANIGL